MFSVNLNGISLIFETSAKSFSPLGIDRGTLAMLSSAELSETDKLLDLGCGYGAVGIFAAKLIGGHNVVMSDIDKTCVMLAQKNAAANGAGDAKIIQSGGFENITDKDFTLILSNPPYHTDFSVAKHFIEKGFNRLVIGGRFYMVTKRKEWYKNKFTAIFGGVKVNEIDGYYIFCAEKRRVDYANKIKSVTRR